MGGLDLAAAALGVRVGLSTDIDPEALSVLHEASGLSTLAGDINVLLHSGELVARYPGVGNPDLLFGGPPCTPFSHAGFWLDIKRTGQDPASSLLERFVDAVKLFLPRAFLLENVPGLTFKTHRPALDMFKERMVHAGYTLTARVLLASDFSVPQYRRRLFVVGVRNRPAAQLDSWPRFVVRTAGEGLRGLSSPPEPDESLSGEYADLLKRITPGGNYLQFTDRYDCDPPRFKNRGRYWSFLLKIDPQKPAPTLPAQRVTYNGPFHWESRHLRIREIARLQGFPDSYPLAPKLTSARRHLGNAVPPPLGMAVLWRVLAAIDLAETDELPAALQPWADPSASYESALADLASRSAPT